MSKNKNTFLAKQIVAWYQINGRKDLPWRKNISVYKIWISEIMLQQTQVATVIPYFKRFIKEYPSLRSLIKASEDDILALWSGLKEVESAYRNYSDKYYQVGVAPYLGEYGDLHTWILIKTKVNSLTNKTSTYPVLKFFKGNFLIELGYNSKTERDTHLMYRFYDEL